MNHDSTETRLRELLWRRELTDAERDDLRSWLALHPEAQPDWEAEQGLSSLLDRLPEPQVSSNFTARVLQAVQRKTAKDDSARPVRRNWSLRSFLPRIALAAIIASAAFYSYRAYETTQRQEMVRSLVAVSQVESMPSPTSLEDFDAIRRLGRTPPVDRELLALMQ